MVASVLAICACGDTGDEPAATVVEPAATVVEPAATVVEPAATVVGGCADVVGAEATAAGDGTFSFAVTVRSADTGWEKYADAWQVLGPDGTVLGTRELLHPHVDEQPFTRSLTGVEVPDDVSAVTVRARDSVAGWCGAEAEVALTR